MHTCNCTKGHKPLEPSHVPRHMYTDIHTHSDSHEHRYTHIQSQIHPHIRQIQVQGMRRKREIKKDHIRSFVYLNSIDSVLLNSRIEHVMTTKGRTMSKVVYVRECPLYSVFWNVSIKCYILCTLVLHFITHTREIMRRESEVATSLLNIDWSRFKFERNIRFLVSVMYYFSTLNHLV